MENNRIANWDIVPNEIRMNIVRYMNRETKRAFRTCSKNSKSLIDRTKLVSSYSGCIENSIHGWMWDLENKVSKSRPFDEAQEGIIKHFENIDCFEIFIVNIDVELFPKSIRLPCGRMNVKQLFFEAQGFVHDKPQGYSIEFNWLKQFNPKYLSHIQVLFEKHGYRQCQAFYDLPQIYLPKSVYIKEYSTIRDDQLLKLNATNLKIEGAECLTKPGITQYLKKCLNELYTKNFCIEITFHGPRYQNLLEGLKFTKIRRHRHPADIPNGERLYVLVVSPYPEYGLLVREKWEKFNYITVTARRVLMMDHEY